MKAIKKYFFFLLSCIFIISCSNSNQPSISTTSSPSRREVGELSTSIQKGMSALYLSTINYNLDSSTRNATTDTESLITITFLDNNSRVHPLVIKTSTDLNVIFEITSCKQLGNNCLLINYKALWEIESEDETIIENNSSQTLISKFTKTGQCVLNTINGKIYDLSMYLNNYVIDNNILFSVKTGVVYKINLRDPTSATPLNNSSTAYINKINMVLGNKLIVNDTYALDIDARIPIKQISYYDGKTLTPPPFRVTTDRDIRIYLYKNDSAPYLSYGLINDSAEPAKYDSNNNLWFLSFGCERYFYNNESIAKYYITGTVNINNDGTLVIDNYSNNRLSFDPGCDHSSLSLYKMQHLVTFTKDEYRYIIRYNGVIKYSLYPTTNGFTVESYSKTFPEEFYDVNNRTRFCIHNMYLYWISNSQIKRLSINQNSTEEIIYEDENITGNLIISDNKLIFNKYIDAITVNSLYFDLNNLTSTPILLSSNSSQTETINELVFTLE